MDVTTFVVGEKFSSYEKLEEKKQLFQENNFIQLWTRDARTIKNAKSRGVKRSLNEQLVYYSIKLACVHGGKDFKCRSSGKRKSR